MILVDTSVWIDHLHKPEPRLMAALEAGQALIHPFVVGELACGNIKNRVEPNSLIGRQRSITVRPPHWSPPRRRRNAPSI